MLDYLQPFMQGKYNNRWKTILASRCQVVCNTFKIQNYFSLKCWTPTPLLANVVYKFQCLNDSNKAYIGKMNKYLTTRVKEHSQGPSAVQNHLDNCHVCKEKYSCKSFVAMDSGKTDFDITIKEALYIRSHKPLLNKQLHSQGSSFILNIFWAHNPLYWFQFC